jgi:outer membrane protein OmpA-like peptidoglycan-associated protein/tetratricopeptide (TPR) repeat protein
MHPGNFKDHLTAYDWKIVSAIFIILVLFLNNGELQSQPETCLTPSNNKAEKTFEKAVRAYRQYSYPESIAYLNEVIRMEPEYTDAYFMLGLIYIEGKRMNLNAARSNFEEVIELCPQYDPYAYFHLARIAYGAEEYDKAKDYIAVFLEDVDRIRSDEDYNEAVAIEEYATFYEEVLDNPVPFDPKPVPGISTLEDEYLPIISPDNELALFTRRIKIPPRRDDITPQVKYRERFMVSRRKDGLFEKGEMMPHPFNLNDNEGGATLTIDNKELFYTLCKYTADNRYYNCDICYSRKKFGTWSEIKNLGDRVNLSNSWESQPSVTSDGKTLYFVSDRPGGYGGYDIYKTSRDTTGRWKAPQNLGPVINTSGNEKSPFIHTDSQTLYFSSDGKMGLGGYDIFFAKLDSSGRWSEPVNIGYPINSFDDDVGFFVSTDGHHGYFASNKFEGNGGWDLYSFNLYEGARPEKVLFVKGNVINAEEKDYKNTRVQLKSVSSRKVTDIPVDTVTGKYVAAVLFRDDYILTVKQKGYVNESRYIARVDPKNVEPLNFPIDLKPIEVGMSYRLNDVYFAFNAFDLPRESRMVIGEFYRFLHDNPTLKVSIEGHTDNIGKEEDNLLLSQRRAKAVYDHLISLGIAPSRLAYKGFGESLPIATNQTDEGRAKNRRTEFVIIEK